MSAGRVAAWTHRLIQKVLHRILTDCECWSSFPGFQRTSEIKRSSRSVREREMAEGRGWGERVVKDGGRKRDRRSNDISVTGVRSDILSPLSHPVARSGWVQGQTQRFPQSNFLKRFIITLKKVIVSNECLEEQRILLCLLVSM